MTETAETQSVTEVALAYQAATTTISGRLSAIMAMLWAQIDPSDPRGSWATLSPQAEGAFVAAQLAAAAQADAYVLEALAAQGVAAGPAAPRSFVDPTRRLGPGALLVEPAAFAGQAASGLALDQLLAIPASRVATALTSGVSLRDARTAAGHSLRMYAETEIPDAARSASLASMSTHHVTGYVRYVGLKCCSRCAILSGRIYRLSRGFRRHPRCRCGMRPYREGDAAPDPMALFREGRITDLTRAERGAIELGADLNQVVNARRGLYVAGDQEFTREGTTLRGVAGARIMARSIAQAGGTGPGGLYTNYSLTRREVAAAVAKYGPLMSRGNPFLRRAALGGTQVAPGRFRTVSGRPSVATIMRTATSPEDARRLLLNYGYVTSRTDEITDLLRPT